jgi:hypothetical protein
VPRYVHAPRVFRRAPERLSALRPPLVGVSEAKRQSPDAAMRARERDGLFEMVKNAAGDVRPHPEGAHAEDVLQTRTCVGASRRMRTATARALMLRHASQRVRALGRTSARVELSMRAGEGAALHFGQTNPPASIRSSPRKRGSMITGRWSWVPALASLGRNDTGLVATPTCGCRKASPARLLCFAPVFYREPCNSNVSSPERGPFGQTNPTCLSLGRLRESDTFAERPQNSAPDKLSQPADS